LSLNCKRAIEMVKRPWKTTTNFLASNVRCRKPQNKTKLKEVYLATFVKNRT
jgi:hypothetical protein